ncbi:MAG: polyphenol oxidase family protein, partial [bacterium]
MFQMRRAGELMILESDLFPKTIHHAFTTRRLAQSKPGSKSGGEANFRLDSLEETSKWWESVRNALFTPDHLCIVNHQVHSGKVILYDSDSNTGSDFQKDGFKLKILGEADAIVKPFTRKPIFLGITTADCLPCLVYDQKTGAAAVVHAGWRGLAADIPANTISGFVKTHKSKPSDLLWAIGPSIDPDHYEVGHEVIAALETAGYSDEDWILQTDIVPGWVHARRADKYLLNLSVLLKMRLINLGVPESQIDISNL